MRLLFLFSLLCASLQATMLSEADLLTEKYAIEIAKAPPPSSFPQTERCLEKASVWFSIDLDRLAVPQGEKALESLNADCFWHALKEIGIEALYLEKLQGRGSFSVNPKWGNSWTKFALHAQRKNISLIGDALKASTSWDSDFEMALQNEGEYPSLFHLVEIAPSDWPLLPSVPLGHASANVPWLALQELHNKGYVPEQFAPYVKKSDWNATTKVVGTDGSTRRWIYLKEGSNRPVFSWLSSSFGAGRIAAGEAIYATFRLGQSTLCVDARLPLFAKETLALWIRKIGAFSAEKGEGTLLELQKSSCDVAFDTLTRRALLHALIAEDAEALRLIYRLYLENGIELKRLIHRLQPFDTFACDWAEFANNPFKKYPYWQEQVTSDLLKKRLLKEDLLRLKERELLPSTWTSFCAAALGIKEAEKEQMRIQKAHLLLAFVYAMQPGIFCFSAADLLGALASQANSLDLLGPNPGTLYASLPLQLKNSHSFASQLKEILRIRKQNALANAEFVDVLPSQNQGTLLLLFRQAHTRAPLILAVNFGRRKAAESVESALFRHATAIELMSSLTQEKLLESPQFSFVLPPLSGKLFFLKKNYYD